MLVVGYHLACVDWRDLPLCLDGLGESNLWLRSLILHYFPLIVRVDRGCDLEIPQVLLVELLHREVVGEHGHIVPVDLDERALSVRVVRLGAGDRCSLLLKIDNDYIW